MYENDHKDQPNTSWWTDYQPPEPDSTLEETVTAQSRNRHLMIGGIAAAVIVLLLVCCGVGYALITQQVENSVAEAGSVAEASSDRPSEIQIFLTADGANDKTTCAKVTIAAASGSSEESQDTVVQEQEVTVNETVSVGQLDPGSYRLRVTSAPVNESGSAYQLPYNDTLFEVKGDGKPVDVFVYLPKPGEIVDPEATEEAPAQEDTASQTGENTEGNSVSSAPATDTESGHTHNWAAQTKTVHHDSEYRTVHHDAVKKRVTICDVCGQNVTNQYTAHKNTTGHSGYHYDTVVVQAAYDEKVLVSAAYNETVTTGYRCSSCGATK